MLLTSEQQTLSDSMAEQMRGITRVDEFDDALDNLTKPGAQLDTLTAFSAAVLGAGILPFVIEDCLRRPDRIREITSRSFRDQAIGPDGKPVYGFVHIGLSAGRQAVGRARDDPKYTEGEFNANFWDLRRRARRARDMRHSHSRDTGSAAVHGVLRHVRAEIVDPTVDGAFPVHILGSGNNIRALGRVSIIELEEELVPAGEVHGITPDLIHRVSVGDDEEVTTLNTRSEHRARVRYFLEKSEQVPQINVGDIKVIPYMVRLAMESQNWVEKPSTNGQ